MPYGTIYSDTFQGSTANTAPVIRDGNSAEVGQFAKSWVNFNGTGTIAVRASFNISSLTDNNTGTYSINFTNALADANYSFVFNGGGTSGAAAVRLDNTSFASQDWDYIFASVFR
jgi:hypothetical protein